MGNTSFFSNDGSMTGVLIYSNLNPSGRIVVTGQLNNDSTILLDNSTSLSAVHDIVSTITGVASGNFVTGGYTGNFTVGGNITATGGITSSGAITTTGNLRVSGNTISSGNISTSGILVSAGDVKFNTTGSISGLQGQIDALSGATFTILTTGSVLPSPAANYQGSIFTVIASGSVPTKTYIGKKDPSGSYFWDEVNKIVDVKHFGAIGDGVTNDTLAIQRALNSVSGTGGKVFVPKGQYLVTGSLSMFSNVVLEGEGPLSKLIATGSNYFRILTGTSINNFAVRDLALIGKRPNTSSPSIWLASTAYTVGQYVSANSNVYLCITGGTSTTGSGPSTTGSNITDGTAHWSYVGVLWQPNDDATFFTDCTIARIENLTCYNFWNDGIIFELSTGAIIEGCSVNNCNKDGIYLSACESSTISNNIVKYTYIGFAIANTWYSTIDSNTSYSNAASDIAIGRDSRYNTVNGNSTEYIVLNQESTIGTTHGVPHTGSLYDYTYGGHRNVISDNRAKRINAFYSNENTITNNVIENGPEIGIYLAGSKRNQVQGNRIYNCANTASVGNSSILLNTFSPGGVLDPTGVTCDDNLILDNHCIDDRTVPLMYGFQLVTGSTGNVIKGNWLSGVAGTPKILDSGTNNLVENNRVSSAHTRQTTFNVRDFGAVGDGITNDTVAIQSTFNAASDNSIVTFPFGSYGITGQIVITGKSLIIDGLGTSSIKELSANTSTGSAGALILVSGAAASNTRIQNLNCEGIETLVSFSSTSGTSEREFCFVRFASVDEGSVFNCTINGKRWGVIADTCTNFLVDGLNFNGILSVPATGTGLGSDNYNSAVRVKAGNKISIRNSIAKNCGSLVLVGVNDSSIDPTRVTTIACHVENSWDNGVYYSSAQDSLVSDCTVLTSNGNGIKVRGSNNQVNNNQVKSCNVGIGFSGAGASPDQYNKTGHGIIISNNRIENITTDGISVDTNTYRTRDIQIVNNYLNSIATTGGGYGAIRGEADRISILGNIFNAVSGAASILLAGTTGDVLEGLNISNNTFLGSSSDAIQLHYTTKSNVNENNFQDILGNAIDLRKCSGCFVSLNKDISGNSGIFITAGSAELNTNNIFSENDGSFNIDAANNTVNKSSFVSTINVKQFGAVGDGVTDDTVAVQSAVTCAVSNYNSTVIIPHGIYKISGTITIPQGIMLECPGSQGANEAYGTVFVHYSNSNLFLWNGASGTAAGTGGGLKNCTIYKASGYSGGDAIKLLAVDDNHRPGEMLFENILTSILGTGMWQRGFHIDGTACTGAGSKGVRSVWFNKVRFTGCSENNQYVFFNQAVHVNGGLQIDQGGGSGTAGMSISGDSENINLECIINGNLIVYDNATHLNVNGRVSTVNIQSTSCIGTINCSTTSNITNNSSSMLINSSSSVTNGTRILVGATGTSINDSQAKVKVYGPVGQPLVDLRATNSGGRVGLTFADGVYGFLDYDPDSSQGVRLSSLNNGPLQLGQNSNAYYGSSTFVTGATVTSGGMTIKSVAINEGSNTTMGTGTLVAGTVVISTTKVTANSRIFLTTQVPGGTPGALYVSARTASTDFTVTSTSVLDTSTFAWWIVEPA